MANYRIEIEVRITQCNDEQRAAPIRQGDGLFTYVLSADQALSIDTCEQAVLAALRLPQKAPLRSAHNT